MMALPAEALARPEFLGSTKLSRTGSTKVIRTPACRQGERMDAVRITVRNQPAYIEQLGLQFRNGGTQYFTVRQEFPGNSRTRWIALRNPRCITAIQISGQSLNLVQKATVEIEGRVRNNNGGGWPGGGNGGGWPGDEDEDDDGYDDGYDDDDYVN